MDKYVAAMKQIEKPIVDKQNTITGLISTNIAVMYKNLCEELFKNNIIQIGLFKKNHNYSTNIRFVFKKTSIELQHAICRDLAYRLYRVHGPKGIDTLVSINDDINYFLPIYNILKNTKLMPDLAFCFLYKTITCTTTISSNTSHPCITPSLFTHSKEEFQIIEKDISLIANKNIILLPNGFEDVTIISSIEFLIYLKANIIGDVSFMHPIYIDTIKDIIPTTLLCLNCKEERIEKINEIDLDTRPKTTLQTEYMFISSFPSKTLPAYTNISILQCHRFYFDNSQDDTWPDYLKDKESVDITS